MASATRSYSSQNDGEVFILPDLLASGLRVVFCGTAPSAASRAASAYYAHPGNRFYAALHEAGFVPRRLEPHEYPALLKHGIGLTDLNKSESGADSDLSAEAFDTERLEKLIREYKPKWLAFTSKRAATIFLQKPTVNYGEAGSIAATRLFVLPSPSGRAVRYWSIEPWCELARLAGFGAG